MQKIIDLSTEDASSGNIPEKVNIILSRVNNELSFISQTHKEISLFDVKIIQNKTDGEKEKIKLLKQNILISSNIPTNNTLSQPVTQSISLPNVPKILQNSLIHNSQKQTVTSKGILSRDIRLNNKSLVPKVITSDIPKKNIKKRQVKKIKVNCKWNLNDDKTTEVIFNYEGDCQWLCQYDIKKISERKYEKKLTSLWTYCLKIKSVPINHIIYKGDDTVRQIILHVMLDKKYIFVLSYLNGLEKSIGSIINVKIDT